MMYKNLLVKLALASSLAITANVAQADLFSDLNQALNTVNNAVNTVNKVSGMTGNNNAQNQNQNYGYNQNQTQSQGYGYQTQNSGVPQAQISPMQRQKITTALMVNTNNPMMNQAINEAKPNIDKLLQAGSCQTNLKLLLGDITSPNARSIYSAMGSSYKFQYHPKSQCVSVGTISNWTMPANNAIQFKVLYSSDVSGEVITRDAELVKLNGRWLVTKHS